MNSKFSGTRFLWLIRLYLGLAVFFLLIARSELLTDAALFLLLPLTAALLLLGKGSTHSSRLIEPNPLFLLYKGEKRGYNAICKAMTGTHPFGNVHFSEPQLVQGGMGPKKTSPGSAGLKAQ